MIISNIFTVYWKIWHWLYTACKDNNYIIFREAIRTSAAMPTAADIIVSHYQIYHHYHRHRHHHRHHHHKKIENCPIIAFPKKNLDIFGWWLTSPAQNSNAKSFSSEPFYPETYFWFWKKKTFYALYFAFQQTVAICKWCNITLIIHHYTKEGCFITLIIHCFARRTRTQHNSNHQHRVRGREGHRIMTPFHEIIFLIYGFLITNTNPGEKVRNQALLLISDTQSRTDRWDKLRKKDSDVQNIS